MAPNLNLIIVFFSFTKLCHEINIFRETTGTAGDANNRTGRAGEAKYSFNLKTSGNVRRVVNNIKDATAGVPGRVTTERTTSTQVLKQNKRQLEHQGSPIAET
jgi:hypothetical protein